MSPEQIKELQGLSKEEIEARGFETVSSEDVMSFTKFMMPQLVMYARTHNVKQTKVALLLASLSGTVAAMAGLDLEGMAPAFASLMGRMYKAQAASAAIMEVLPPELLEEYKKQARESGLSFEIDRDMPKSN